MYTQAKAAGSALYASYQSHPRGRSAAQLWASPYECHLALRGADRLLLRGHAESARCTKYSPRKATTWPMWISGSGFSPYFLRQLVIMLYS